MANSDDSEFKKKLISDIYIVEKEEDLEIILSTLQETEAEIIEENVNFCEAYTGKKYRYASWNAVALVISQ